MSENDFKLMLSNPFYCLKKIDPIFTLEHEPLITEEEWIRVGSKLIDEIGAEAFLECLLENLKGNYISVDNELNN